MPPKRIVPSKLSDNEIKCQRKMLTIQENVKLLNVIKDDRKIMEIVPHYDLNEPTIHFIHEDEKNIHSTATVFFNNDAKLEGYYFMYREL